MRSRFEIWIQPVLCQKFFKIFNNCGKQCVARSTGGVDRGHPTTCTNGEPGEDVGLTDRCTLIEEKNTNQAVWQPAYLYGLETIALFEKQEQGVRITGWGELQELRWVIWERSLEKCLIVRCVNTVGWNEQVVGREWTNNVYVHQEKLRKVVGRESFKVIESRRSARPHVCTSSISDPGGPMA